MFSSVLVKARKLLDRRCFTRRNQNYYCLSVSHDNLHLTANMETACCNEDSHNTMSERDKKHFRYRRLWALNVRDLTPVICDEANTSYWEVLRLLLCAQCSGILYRIIEYRKQKHRNYILS
jgi:hypothetical protein